MSTPLGTQYPELFARLAAPFDKSEIKQRKAPGGRMLDYITARLAMNRLDEVLGPENWWARYRETKKGVRCRLTIVLPDGTKIAKEDGGAAAGMTEPDNDEKSGYSDAFKRAAAVWGIARYLYKDGVPDFGDAAPSAPTASPSTNGSPASAPRPTPSPASSGNGSSRPPTTPAPTPAPRTYSGPREGWDERNARPLTNPRGVYPRMCDLETYFSIDIKKPLNAFAKAQGWPFKTSEWDEGQVAEAWEWMKDHIRSKAPSYGGEFEAEGEPEEQPQQDTGPTLSPEELKKLKRDLVTAVGRMMQLRDNLSVVPDYPTIRAQIDLLSEDMARDGDGNGEVIGDLLTCSNVDLIRNVLAEATKLLNEVDGCPFG